MRFFEFEGDDLLDRFVLALRNYIGRAESKKARAKLNWAGLNQVLKASKVELATDYTVFKMMYDSSPTLQGMISDFNSDGIELNVPGTDKDTQTPVKQGQTSQDAVDKAAASAAPQQLAAQAWQTDIIPVIYTE
jgi:hypothetical protein